MEIIHTSSLTKIFGSTTAVDSVSIHVEQGEIYGFLGLNGAGKTTLIRMLLGMIQPNNGNIKLFGKEVNPKFNLWNEIGYLVETPHSYPNLTVFENLNIYSKLRNINHKKQIENIIERLHLSKYRNIKSKNLSLGNLQRLGLAKALFHEPKLLVLDEPINGLDPVGIVEVRELLIELSNKGTTIFLSSHILGEILKIAHRIGIIHKGRLIKELHTMALEQQLIKKVLINTADNKKALSHLIKKGYEAILNKENFIECRDNIAIAEPEKISSLLVNLKLPAKQIFIVTEDLEMYFLRIIEKGQ